MNIRKRLAVAAAIVLPATGLAVIGGSQLVSAGGPPVLTCSGLTADPANTTGGVTFDNGTGAGSAGLDLGAGLNTSPATATDELALPSNGNGDDVVQLTAEAIAGQTITFPGSLDTQTYTVVSDSTQKLGVAGAKNLETAIITPANTSGVAVAKKSTVSIGTSTTGAYGDQSAGNGGTYNNTSVTTGSDVVTATSADFTGDVGLPVTVTYYDTAPNTNEPGDPPYDLNFNPFNPPQAPVTPSIVSEYISAVGGGGDTATISAYESPTGSPLNSATELADSQVSASVAVTVGSTSQETGTVGTDYDFAFTSCESSLHADAGVIYPNNVTFTNTGPVTNPSSAIALEGGVNPINGAQVNFPSGLPSGYSYGNGTNPTGFVAGGDGGYEPVTFNSAKDSLNLLSDEESFVDGVAGPGDVAGGVYGTTKAAMAFGVGSMVVCTDAQLQAIYDGTGIDHSSIPKAADSAAVGPEALQYCDGGTSSLTNSVDAFNELAGVEANPNGGEGGSDGTGLGAIWQVSGTGTATF